ncbi:MAG: DNA polymerase III subunit delta', partial [Pseudomonadota bacterium]|nr:DNA polymerase III subunit delta' [Pseudomonadota bacterium]
MDLLTADTLPWLRQYQQRWRDALASGRPPHSVMIVSAPGLGAEHLAVWMAAFTLCERAIDGPCRICASCVLLRADSHPDYHVVRLDDESKQIKVDQVRELIAKLALKSYRRGYKVGVIEGAEALNANGANAFLKTLEEPAADTLLVIVARPSHRLPATVASRCLRLALRVPPRSEALEWLRA